MESCLSILITGVLFLGFLLIVVVTAYILLSRNARSSICSRKKHGLTNGRGDTLGFLKGGTSVNRELLTNKVNQLRRGMNTLEIVDCLHEALNDRYTLLSERIKRLLYHV